MSIEKRMSIETTMSIETYAVNLRHLLFSAAFDHFLCIAAELTTCQAQPMPIETRMSIETTMPIETTMTIGNGNLLFSAAFDQN